MLDIANDWVVVDNLESVTYASKVNDLIPYPASVTIPNVLSRVTMKKLNEGGKMMSIRESTYHIWKVQAGGVIPKVNDRITTTDGVFVVKEVSSECFDTRWKLTCRGAQ